MTQKLLNLKDRFVSFINLRKISNPVNSPEIEEHFKMTGTEVRELINHLRNEGLPIANTLIEEGKIRKAYFWAESWDEMKLTIIDLENRAYNELTTCKNIRKRFNQHLEPTLF